jgi:cellulose synthase/poly-beta-1,6-N-acetylglucosamine synthase-like glycosyltransferase
MLGISHIVLYIMLFIALYFEVFILLTYVENRNSIKEERENSDVEPKSFPMTSIVVPCWNEETTIVKTIESLLLLDYPKDKFEILIVDDGSTDKTWEVLQQFKDNDNIRLFTKENGGKHTAVNFALAQSRGELIGCLDADSYVVPDTLKNIVLAFEKDSEVMAVTPSVKIFQPKNVIELIQSVEYMWAIFLRKMLSLMGAIYVTPGPFSIFRKEVFEKIGFYKKAYLTEDMEMAMRMQANNMKIGNAYTAVVWTSAPDTLHKLYKQRTRWTYGFVKNVVEYRYMFFDKKYGNLGIFVLPLACISILATIFAAGVTVVGLIQAVTTEVVRIQTIGFHLPQLSFTLDWFSINTELLAVISVVALIGTVVTLLLSRKMVKGKMNIGIDMIYFLALYSFIAPLWLIKAVYNVIFSVTTNWR